MSSQTKPATFWHKLGGIYLIPHELLHVLAYRIIGKPCDYQWGNHFVRPLAKRTKAQRIFVLLLPFVTFLVLGCSFQLLWAAAAFFLIRMPLDKHFAINGLTWHYLLPVIGMFLLMYCSTAHSDLIVTYNVLRGKDKSHEEGYDDHTKTNSDNVSLPLLIVRIKRNAPQM